MITLELELLIFELEKKFQNLNVSKLSVSSGNSGWHLYHSLKVINVITKSLEESDISNYKWKFNFSRSLVFLFGIIPRGKGKAPKIVQPLEAVTSADLKKELDLSKISQLTLDILDKNANFNHPYFGVLNKKQAIRFLEIHTNHHLKIIKDINRG